MSQTLAPHLIHYLEVLRMDNFELKEYMESMEQRNPLFEVEYPYEHKRALSFDSYVQGGFLDARAQEADEFASPVGQLGQTKLHPKTRNVAHYILASLNPCGYLEEELEDIAERLCVSIDTAKHALAVVQELEPCGIGARDLKECLALQLKRYGEQNTLAMAIVQNTLYELSKNQYSKIARILKTDVDAVRAAAARIRRLNPKPGDFADKTVYITPDVLVEKTEDELVVSVNEISVPRVGINQYYKRLLKSTDDAEAIRYITEKLQHANTIKRNLELRNKTLIKCAALIVRAQRGFFYNGGLNPLSLTEIAEKMNMHESTVCRTIKNKYMQYGGSVYPFRYFFTNGVGSNSAYNIIKQIEKLIQGENKSAPLSDQQLCDILRSHTIDISRRTVAKYREKCGIPCAASRRCV